MSDRVGQSQIVQELLNLRPGVVRSFLGGDFKTLQQHLEDEGLRASQPIVLMKELQDIPTTSELIKDVLVTMATTARNLWPVWFTDVHFGLGLSPTDPHHCKIEGY